MSRSTSASNAQAILHPRSCSGDGEFRVVREERPRRLDVEVTPLVAVFPAIGSRPQACVEAAVLAQILGPAWTRAPSQIARRRDGRDALSSTGRAGHDIAG
jgi:hypothetical protein